MSVTGSRFPDIPPGNRIGLSENVNGKSSPTWQGDRLLLPVLPPEPVKVRKTQQNLHQGRTRRRQPDPEDGDGLYFAEQQRQRNAHAECAGNPLRHDKSSPGTAAEKPDKTEQK